ncbi:MAG: IS4 family transposase [Verrucomicrobia bacterium]|nr:IS4 family transposase [Verrucomicrobiota bacterium]
MEPNDSTDEFSCGRLKGARLVGEFRRLLADELDKREPGTIDKSESDPRRRIFADNYFSALLLAYYNPVLSSARAIVGASKNSATVREALGCDSPLSLGSFSEAQHLFDSELLLGVIRSLRDRLKAPGSADANPQLADFVNRIAAVDSTFFEALPRMQWAVYRTKSETKRIRLHLIFNVLDGSIEDAAVTPAAACERRTLVPRLEAGRLYCGDRYYGLDYGYFERFRQAGADALIRVRDEPLFTVLEDNELSAEALAYGVLADQTIVLGPEGSGHPPLRLITLQREGRLIRLATTLTDADAVELCMLYRYRWEIETFFKWLKVILGTRGFLGESRNAVTAQLYAALIMALLLSAFTGKRPTKRQMEAIQLFQMGWMTSEELAQALNLKKSD